MQCRQFQQTNIAGVLHRSCEILQWLKELSHNLHTQERIAGFLLTEVDEGDDHEKASLMIVKLELMNRSLADQDPSIAQPAGYNGGMPT